MMPVRDYLNGVPAVLRPDPGPGEAGEEEEEEGREGVQAVAPAEGSAVAEARISPGQLLERAAAIKLDYAELQGCAQMAAVTALGRGFWLTAAALATGTSGHLCGRRSPSPAPSPSGDHCAKSDAEEKRSALHVGHYTQPATWGR